MPSPVISNQMVISNALRGLVYCLTFKRNDERAIRAKFRMECGPMSTVDTGRIDWPRKNDGRIVINFVNVEGRPIDVSGATEITFTIAESTKGPSLITKTLSSGQIILATNSQGFTLITDTETNLAPKKYYYECRITNADAQFQTVAAGAFVIQDTLIGV